MSGGARLLGVVAVLLLSPQVASATQVSLLTVSGSINPASADYIIQAIERAEEEGAAALLIELDTPGGLVSSTKDIIQKMLNAQVPTIVYVAPRGAWASSAGTFITIAANVAAMAPGTSIGAAHPVGIGGGGGGGDREGEDQKETRDHSMQKAENLLAAYMETIAKERGRNVEWVVEAVRTSVAVGETEALELGVIDLVAESRSELLAAIEGREVDVAGETRILEVAGLPVVPVEMTTVQRLFDFLANPDVAVLLMLAGMLGIYVEVNNPGLILPGVVGAVCLVLTGIAFQILPFSWVGLLLLLAGMGLLVAEIFVPSFGTLFALGLACLLMGGSMLFDMPQVSDLTVSFWAVLFPAVMAMAIFGGIVVFAVGRKLWIRQTAGVDELIGLVGRATTALEPEGKVFVRGEYWTAEADESIGAGEAVELTGVDGLRLRVRRAGSQ